jgi:hypothetical protein
MPIIQPKSGAPEVPDGVYTVKCIKVAEEIVEDDPFGKPDKVRLTLQLEGSFDADGKPVFLDPRVNQAWSKRATLYKYALAFGLKPSLSDGFDTDALIGKRATATVYTEEEGGWPRITALVPLKAQAAPAAKAAPQASSPSEQSAAMAALAAEVDKNALASFWEAVGESGTDRGTVADMADTMFGKSVSKLTSAERDELLGQVLLGA